jgi:MraZ protein
VGSEICIRDWATFVGIGQRCQVWEPKAYDEYYAKALEEAQRNRDLLRSPAAQPGNGTGGAR